MEKMMYIFGYGSLMYPSGINGRGMDYNYTWKDLSVSRLSDYKRGIFAHYINNTYYGIMESKGDMVNGVLFKIHSNIDFERLMIDEKSSETYQNTKKEPVYKIVDVTNKITFPKKCSAKIFTLVNTKDKSCYGKITKSYLRHVHGGIQPWGPDFVNNFLKTGGILPDQ
jgi:cation transport regulator ChaC